MKSILLALSGLVSFVTGELHNYNFNNYITEHDLIFDANEHYYREEIFNNEKVRVETHNRAKLSWSETINHLSVLSPEEKKAFNGFNMVAHQLHQSNYIQPFEMPVNYQLPESVDWREAGVVSAVKDQGHCGSCWAFASTAVIESHIALNSSRLFDLSPQQIAACSPNPDHCGGQGNCNGATAEIAFEYVAGSNGLLQEFQYPYTSYYGQESECLVPNSLAKGTIHGYVQLPANNYDALMYAVANIGPIGISVDASNWHAYQNGIFNGCNQTNPDINHAVVLVGYGEENGQKYWLVRNSWSASWGENGYIRLARFDDDEQRCGLDIAPQDGSACEGDLEPVIACGTCGILFDSAYPTGASLV